MLKLDASPALMARGVIGRSGVIVAFLGVALFVVPAVLGGDWIKTLTAVAIYAVVAAGLVTLYGRVGMISLGQIALLAIGTWTATRISFAAGLPFPVLLLVTGAITCVVGVLIGLPALQPSSQLFRAPAAVVAARAQDRFHDQFRRGVGLLVWRARLVGQRGSPAQRISLAPFIARFSTNTESATQLGEELIAWFDGFHEGQSLFHGTGFFPAHQLL